MTAPSKTSAPEIIILGGSTIIAPWLIKRLHRSGWIIRCRSRHKPDLAERLGIDWQYLDVDETLCFDPGKHSVVVSLLPIWKLAELLPKMKPCRQLIAFSTTSVFGKKNSPCPEEQGLVKIIETAEKAVLKNCERLPRSWTIFRPTLIYDCQTDGNITRMARFVKKWKILPIAAPANGLRQPVHADDLAVAVVRAIDNPIVRNRFYDLGGGEILSYYEMCRRVFQALGMRPRILCISLKTINLIIKMINRFTARSPNNAMFIRMNQDLVYDQTSAQKDLGYRPRDFYPDFHLACKASASLLVDE